VRDGVPTVREEDKTLTGNAVSLAVLLRRKIAFPLSCVCPLNFLFYSMLYICKCVKVVKIKIVHAEDF